MDVYAGMDPRLPLAEVGAYARRVEAMGYDGLHVPETIHDSLTAAAIAVEHTDAIVVRTCVTLAFVRSPLLTAYAAWDLAALSGGRFELGLGTQVRQNIEERHGMPWSPPVTRLAEFLDAIGAAWQAFATGEPPAFRGEHYRLTRLQPYFNPGPDGVGSAPPVWLGGVNTAMCELAGMRAAGLLTHPTASDPRTLDTVCLPALDAGARDAGRAPGEVRVVAGPNAITGTDRDELARERERQRRLFAFLWSTPAYEGALARYGWGELGPRLRDALRRGDEDEASRLVTDEVLDALVPVATYDDLAGALIERYARRVDGVTVRPPDDPANDGRVGEVVAAIRADSSRRVVSA